MYYDVIIIGGGASGLCTAIKVKKENISVLVLEHGDRTARKILSTGNGKCNLTNSFCKVSLFNSNPERIYPYYSSGDKSFIESVIDQFDCDDTIDFFESLGVLTLDRNGYIYPRSEQASQINNILRYTCMSRGVDIVTGVKSGRIERIDPENNNGCRFRIGGEYYGKNLVMACGGMSAKKTGSDGSGYIMASTLGHTLITPVPALCAVRCSDTFTKELAGVRNDSAISLYDVNNELVMRTFGNVQFTAYGVSGIPVFQMSHIIGKMLLDGNTPELVIDLLPEYKSEIMLSSMLNIDHSDSKTDESGNTDRLLGILNSKLACVIAKEDSRYSRFSKGMTYGERVTRFIKHFRMHPSGLNSFDEAQTTAGGISTCEIDKDTMQSLLVSGLYFTGEIIDVNGICGGYNLQWAWSTAHIAAESIIRSLS